MMYVHGFYVTPMLIVVSMSKVTCLVDDSLLSIMPKIGDVVTG